VGCHLNHLVPLLHHEGSYLHLNGLLLISNDGCAGFSVVTDGEIAQVRVEHLQELWTTGLEVEWKSNVGGMIRIPKTAWV